MATQSAAPAPTVTLAGQVTSGGATVGLPGKPNSLEVNRKALAWVVIKSRKKSKIRMAIILLLGVLNGLRSHYAGVQFMSWV